MDSVMATPMKLSLLRFRPYDFSNVANSLAVRSLLSEKSFTTNSRLASKEYCVTVAGWFTPLPFLTAKTSQPLADLTAE